MDGESDIDLSSEQNNGSDMDLSSDLSNRSKEEVPIDYVGPRMSISAKYFANADFF